MAGSVGTAYIEVLPSLRGFQSKVKSELEGMQLDREISLVPRLDEGVGRAEADKAGAAAGDAYGGRFAETVRARIEAAMKALPDAKITADSSEAESKLALLRAQLAELAGKRLGIDISDEEALAKVAEIRAELDTLKTADEISVRVDAARAEAELAKVAAEVEAVDGKDAKVDIDVDDHGSAENAKNNLEGVYSTVKKWAGLIPIVTALGSAVAGLGAGAVVGAGGLAAVGLGFLGITSAVGAMNDAQEQSAQDALEMAKQQANAADQIVSAQERVRSSQAAVANAEANAADAQIRAAEAVANAEQQLSDAVRQAATAQRDLTQARIDAARALEDLSNQARDGALAERQAVLDLERAHNGLQATMSNPQASLMQREQAQLTYDQAQAHLDEIRQKNQRVAEDKSKADALGVDGARNVVQAQNQVISANERIGNATKAVGDAQRAQVAQQRQAAYSVDQAQQQVIDSQRALQAAIRNSATQGSQDLIKLRQAMGNLSPAGQEFARFLFSLKPAFDQLRATAQAGFLPGLQAGIQALLPVLPQINTVVGQVATAMGNLFREAGQALAGPFWSNFFGMLGSVAIPLTEQFSHSMGALSRFLANLVTALMPVAPIALQVLTTLAHGLSTLAPYLGQMAGVLTQSLLVAFQSLLPAMAPFGQALAALAPLAGSLIQLIGGALSAAVQALAPVVIALAGPLTQVVNSLAGPLTAAIGSLAGPLGQVAGVLGQVISSLAGPLASVIGQLAPIIGQAAGILGGVLVQALQAVQPVLPPLLESLDRIASVLGQAFLQALTALAPVIPPVAEALVQVLDSLLPLIDPLLQLDLAIITPLIGLIPTLVPLIVQVADSFAQIMPQLVPVVLTLINSLLPVIQQLMPLVTTVFTVVVQIISWALSSIVVPLLVNVVIPTIRFLASVFQWLSDNVVVPVFRGFSDFINVVWTQSLKPCFDAISSGIHGVGQFFSDTGDWIHRTWDEIKSFAADPVRWVVDMVYNRGIVPTWDKIADLFHLARIDPIPLNFAGGGVLGGYAPGRDIVHAMLSPGESVLVPELTAAIGPANILRANREASGRAPTIVGGGFSGGGVVPGFAGGGILDWVGNAASSVGGFLAHVGTETARLFTDPGGVLRDALAGAIGGFGQFAQSPFVQGMEAIPAKFIDAAVAKVRDLFAAPAANLGNIGGGVQQWSGVVLQALSMLGLPATELPHVLRRMNQESGGNPQAINLWDSNAARGTPSIGLMQVIQPTFAAYAGPLRDRGIYDALANTYAGLNYAIHAYPSLDSAMDRPGGYDSGGWLPPGLQTVYNGTRRPEAVLTGPQWDALMNNQSGGGQFTGDLYLDSGQFLGVVNGAIDAAHDRVGTAIAHRARI